MWLEEHEGERINEMRTDEALALSSDQMEWLVLSA